MRRKPTFTFRSGNLFLRWPLASSSYTHRVHNGGVGPYDVWTSSSWSVREHRRRLRRSSAAENPSARIYNWVLAPGPRLLCTPRAPLPDRGDNGFTLKMTGARRPIAHPRAERGDFLGGHQGHPHAWQLRERRRAILEVELNRHQLKERR